ncbi:MAG: isoleucine--tRNA ligase [Gemmatimonadaceae bacterium]|nr:isoleucine--tRNA ligase [Gemmatimonadaceae bacterium]
MSARPYRLLPADRSADDLEQEILAAWRVERLFERSVELRKDGTPYVFFDGPPTANGRPGIHHVFARTVKDLYCRHRAMHGHHVPRKAGWDTHGLPVEIEVEKALGIKGKPDIEALGIEAFNRKCRESVWKYRAEWEQLCERIAHWLDYEHPYVTYHNAYIESEWWALKTLHERGYLYKGHKILPYCARCGTSLSSHEVAQGYQDVEDPSVFVALDLVDPAASAAGVRRRLIVWTTTPWTLVSNVALAVHPDIGYVELKKRNVGDWTIVLATSRAAAVLGADYADRWDVVRHLAGSELVGRRYRRPLDLVAYPEGDREHELIVGADFVSEGDGSGIVHMAPAFGQDDYAIGRTHGLAMLNPVDLRGRFETSVPLVGGLWVKDADRVLVEELERRDVLWKAGTMRHPYPHCWRCSTPLLYYARESWFVRTTGYREDMLARNANVDWHPEEVGSGRFGVWLQNNIDWAISRDRYWGTPLPVWVCDRDAGHLEVVGSFAELSRRAERPLPADFDPHKPFIDDWHWSCACGGTMRRVPEVIDAWFDSGAMPFAQWHYPFENRERVEREYPADFIAEGLDQTRGWFYSLLAIAAGLGDALPNNGVGGHTFETAPYRTVVVNDLVLDANGVKMSKRLGNVVNPFEVVARHGADAVRLFLVASSQLGAPKRFDESVIRDTAAGFLMTLRNVYSGIFAQYANDGWRPEQPVAPAAERPTMDRWILSRLTSVEAAVDAALTGYDATAASRLIMSFLVDDVSNWYVRQTRSRFYDVTSPDNAAAFATLHEVLVTVCRLVAPIAPYISDWIHRELTGSTVHLESFVRPRGYSEPALEEAMEDIRELSRLGRAAREEASINVRRPLSRAQCVVPAGRVDGVQVLLPVLALELNIKAVSLLSSADDLVTLEARPNFKSLGSRFGKATPLAAKAVQGLSSADLRRFEGGEPVVILVGGESHPVASDDLSIVRRAVGDLVVKEAGGRFVAIDPTITPELRREGLARELVSRIQRMRKDAGLAVSDRIRLRVRGDAEIEQSVREYIDWMAGEVLARHVDVGGPDAPDDHAAQAVELDGLQARVALRVDP